MGEFSLTHILVVLILFLVFFGPKRLPQMGQSLGEAIRGFKDAMNADPNKDKAQNQAQQPVQHPAPPPPPPIQASTAPDVAPDIATGTPVHATEKDPKHQS